MYRIRITYSTLTSTLLFFNTLTEIEDWYWSKFYKPHKELITSTRGIIDYAKYGITNSGYESPTAQEINLIFDSKENARAFILFPDSWYLSPSSKEDMAQYEIEHGITKTVEYLPV